MSWIFFYLAAGALDIEGEGAQRGDLAPLAVRRVRDHHVPPHVHLGLGVGLEGWA